MVWFLWRRETAAALAEGGDTEGALEALRGRAKGSDIEPFILLQLALRYQIAGDDDRALAVAESLYGSLRDLRDGIDVATAVAVSGGKIALVAPAIPAAEAKSVAGVAGLYVTPGLIDAHVHLSGSGEADSQFYAPAPGSDSPRVRAVRVEYTR